MRYDWTRVSRQALENLAAAADAESLRIIADGNWTGGTDAALKQVREEAQVAPRTKADVDAEIVAKFRDYMTSEASERDTDLWHDLEDLVLEPVAEPVSEHEAVFLRKLQSEGEVKEIAIQADVKANPIPADIAGRMFPTGPRELLLSQPVNETPESLQLLVKAAFVHRQGEGVQYTPALAPTLAQVKLWDPATFAEVARWARLEHALAHPIAGQDYPEREPLPRAVADLVEQNDAMLKAAEGKPPKKKRAKRDPVPRGLGAK